MASLTDIINRAKLYVDETPTGSKFDSYMTEFVRIAWQQLSSDINATSRGKMEVRYDIEVVADTEDYALPPSVGQILKFEKVNSSGLVEWEIVPRHPLNPAGPGFQVLGPTLRISPTWSSGETMRLTYLPSGEVPPHDGTGELTATDDGTDVTACTAMTINTVVTGTLDTRENAYAGMVFRLLTEGSGKWGESTGDTAVIVQERMITAYDPLTKVITFSPGLDPLPEWSGTSFTDGSCTYEVVPLHMKIVEEALALRIARKMAHVTGDMDRGQALNLEFHDALRTIKDQTTRAIARTGHRFERRVRGRR